MLFDDGEPECYDETLEDENPSKWELAMQDEANSLKSNQTWELTELPLGMKALYNKWVYGIKKKNMMALNITKPAWSLRDFSKRNV